MVFNFFILQQPHGKPSPAFSDLWVLKCHVEHHTRFTHHWIRNKNHLQVILSNKSGGVLEKRNEGAGQDLQRMKAGSHFLTEGLFLVNLVSQRINLPEQEGWP